MHTYLCEYTFIHMFPYIVHWMVGDNIRMMSTVKTITSAMLRPKVPKPLLSEYQGKLHFGMFTHVRMPSFTMHFIVWLHFQYCHELYMVDVNSCQCICMCIYIYTFFRRYFNSGFIVLLWNLYQDTKLCIYRMSEAPSKLYHMESIYIIYMYIYIHIYIWYAIGFTSIYIKCDNITLLPVLLPMCFVKISLVKTLKVRQGNFKQHPQAYNYLFLKR